MNSRISVAIVRDALTMSDTRAKEYLDNSPLCPGVKAAASDLIDAINQSNDAETVTEPVVVADVLPEPEEDTQTEAFALEEEEKAPEVKKRGIFG